LVVRVLQSIRDAEKEKSLSEFFDTGGNSSDDEGTEIGFQVNTIASGNYKSTGPGPGRGSRRKSGKTRIFGTDAPAPNPLEKPVNALAWLIGNTLDGAIDFLGHITKDDIGIGPQGLLSATEKGGELLIRSVDDVIGAVSKFIRLKGGVRQGMIQGNADEIFKTITEGGTKLESGAVKLGDGTIINLHKSKSTGASTIDINKGDQIYKIRVEE
jgi:hypothetical protein